MLSANSYILVDFNSGDALVESNPDMRVEPASITKVFTAAILLQLHEEGVLSLDDSLSTWLPELAASIPNGEAMTLRQLASHTAGLNEYERDLYPLPQLIGDQTLVERTWRGTLQASQTHFDYGRLWRQQRVSQSLVEI